MYFLLGGLEHAKPWRIAGQWNAQLTGGQVNAGARNLLRLVAHEDVRAETVVHVVPGALHQPLVVFKFEIFEVHDDKLVRMMVHVDAEAELFQHATLSLYHLALQVDVVLVQYDGR